jgi:hypothetical protein
MFDLIVASAFAQTAALKDPFSYGWQVYAWVMAWAGAGGFVSFYQKMKRGDVRAFNIVELVGELVTSAFVGILTFWICEAYQVPQLLEAVAISVSGHMGTRVIFMIEQWATKKFGVDSDNAK